MGTASLRQIAAGNLRAEMARQKLTGVDLADLLKCSQQSASRRITGAQGLDLDELPVVADWLGTSIAALLSTSRETAEAMS